LAMRLSFLGSHFDSSRNIEKVKEDAILSTAMKRVCYEVPYPRERIVGDRC